VRETNNPIVAAQENPHLLYNLSNKNRFGERPEKSQAGNCVHCLFPETPISLI